MSIKDQVLFFDTSTLAKTAGIEARATERYVRAALEARFPGERFEEIAVSMNTGGVYRGKDSAIERMLGSSHRIEGLPPYVEVTIRHSTGQYCEELIVWSPLAWNDRFAGTAGGGTGIGGRSYLTVPNNGQRGWTVPFAVMNGFTAATMYAGNGTGLKDLTIDPKTGTLRQEVYENWRLRSTHNMTRFGKAVAEILHDRPVRYSYMNGGSGGGRQSLMEAQNYPEDYDGIWAACPAIHWHEFLLGGYWAEVLQTEYHGFLSPKKNQFFLDAVHAACGCAEDYYHLDRIPEMDARAWIGAVVPGSGKTERITDDDAAIMNALWKGPHRRNGERLWYGVLPGCKNWQQVIPIGTYYYPLPFGSRIRPFALGPMYARWITHDPKETFDHITRDKLEQIYDSGAVSLRDCYGDNADLRPFAAAGGKLLMDHGMDDPLIPVQGTLDYYQQICDAFGGKQKADAFCRLYVNPGDNHGNCWGNGPGITECDGMRALIHWVEQGAAPETLRTVRMDQKTGMTLEEGTARPMTAERMAAWGFPVTE